MRTQAHPSAPRLPTVSVDLDPGEFHLLIGVLDRVQSVLSDVVTDPEGVEILSTVHPTTESSVGNLLASASIIRDIVQAAATLPETPQYLADTDS